MLKIKPIATGTAVSIRGALGLLPATTADTPAPVASPATAAQFSATTLPVKDTLRGGIAFTRTSRIPALLNRLFTGLESLSRTRH
jgi:hypothetical protein